MFDIKREFKLHMKWCTYLHIWENQAGVSNIEIYPLKSTGLGGKKKERKKIFWPSRQED